MELDINEIIKRAQEFTKSSTVAKNYIQPQYYYWHGQILVPTGTEFGICDYMWYLSHIFPDVPENKPDPDLRLDVIHGHISTQTCSTPTFCHLYGYWPDETNSPSFKNQFELKWGKIYRENKWN